MILKLKDIATVSVGLTFRSRVEVSASGNVRIIQMKDLGEDNIVHLDQTARVEYARPKPSQQVQIGDIIFRSRGQTNTAAILNEEAADTIVAAPLFRVRPNSKKVMPEFLLWWINQPSAQHYFSSQSAGTIVKMVSKQALDNLEVRLPPMQRQHKIAEFFNLSLQEQRLLEEIKKRKALYTQGILMQMVSESRLTASHTKTGFGATASTPGQTQSRVRT